ncbi:MAG: AAA-like domain-containing protein [Bacteroidia bacterium]
MRTFNTSGPNHSEKYYTIHRTKLIEEGILFVENERYFTIWAPRQTGKTTYFRQLATELNAKGYKTVFFSTEGFDTFSEKTLMNVFCQALKKQQGISWKIPSFEAFGQKISAVQALKLVVIIDEIEGLNPILMGQFLHLVRNLYHTKESHCLKSVILVGVSNIVGVVLDNASPFNIAENINVPYFTKNETFALLEQHEQETGQLFAQKVKEKIHEITAGQPGLVNGFANQLVTRYKAEKNIEYTHYEEVEHWYLNVAIDKNFQNILNKANQYRTFVENLLFNEADVPFQIQREAIKVLHTQGVIRENAQKMVEFWVPFYKKSLYAAFYPYTNGESKRIAANIFQSDFITETGKLDISAMILGFKEYVQRRGFGVFREKTGAKDDKGKDIYKSIPEAAMVYSFETYLQAFLSQMKGKSYREAHVGLGRSDLIININQEELLIETKIYHGYQQFEQGKKQTAYYCKKLGLNRGIYLVFIEEAIQLRKPDLLKEDTFWEDGVELYVYLVKYDEEKDF